MASQQYLKQKERWVVAANKDGIINVWPHSLYDNKNKMILSIFGNALQAEEWIASGEAEAHYQDLKAQL